MGKAVSKNTHRENLSESPVTFDVCQEERKGRMLSAGRLSVT